MLYSILDLFYIILSNLIMKVFCIKKNLYQNLKIVDYKFAGTVLHYFNGIIIYFLIHTFKSYIKIVEKSIIT